MRRLDPHIADSISEEVDKFAESGHGDVQSLVAQAADWRLRLRAWRVLYNLEDNDQTIVVIRVLHRREAYRRR